MSVIIGCQKADRTKTSVSIPDTLYWTYVAKRIEEEGPGSDIGEELARVSIRDWARGGFDSSDIQSKMVIALISPSVWKIYDRLPNSDSEYTRKLML